MRRTFLAALALSFCTSTVACDRASEAPASAEHVDDHAEPSGHAPAGAKPGSHEDWCGEHQVPESMCTRCNASLIPAFKQTGDWCDEHGMPQTQCLACDPSLKIERPPKTGSP